MIILAMDTTAKTAAAALLDGEKLLAKDAREGQGAHSAALLPMIEDLFSRTGIGSDGVDLYAASAGPGSFTGVRIGAATLKGLAFGRKRPAAEVSALEALAYNLRDTDCTACALMDARRGQFYTALFRCGGGLAARLTPDEAKSGEEIAAPAPARARSASSATARRRRSPFSAARRFSHHRKSVMPTEKAWALRRFPCTRPEKPSLPKNSDRCICGFRRRSANASRA